MAEEANQTAPVAGDASVESIPQATPNVTEVGDSQGSEAQTNTEDSGKLIPIPSQKWREANQTIRQLKDELDAVKSSQAEPASTQYTDESEQAIQRIADGVHQRIAPALNAFERIERQQAIEDVGNRPYAAELAKDIAKHFSDPLNQSLPVRDRMDRAYRLSLADNLDKLQDVAQKTGYDAAYNKISEKQSAEGTHQGAAKPRESGTLTPDEIAALPPREYEKRREEIFSQQGLGTPPNTR
jgi:hypothetical protein